MRKSSVVNGLHIDHSDRYLYNNTKVIRYI